MEIKNCIHSLFYCNDKSAEKTFVSKWFNFSNNKEIIYLNLHYNSSTDMEIT